MWGVIIVEESLSGFLSKHHRIRCREHLSLFRLTCTYLHVPSDTLKGSKLALRILAIRYLAEFIEGFLLGLRKVGHGCICNVVVSNTHPKCGQPQCVRMPMVDELGTLDYYNYNPLQLFNVSSSLGWVSKGPYLCRVLLMQDPRRCQGSTSRGVVALRTPTL